MTGVVPPLSFAFEPTYTYGARRNGKTSGARAAWTRGTTWHSPDWVDAGIVADPITITRADLATFTPDELDFLAAHTFPPNVDVVTDTAGRVDIIARPPRVTTLT